MVESNNISYRQLVRVPVILVRTVALVFLLHFATAFAQESPAYRVGLYESKPFVVFSQSEDVPDTGLIPDFYNLIEPHLDKPIEYVRYSSWDELINAAKRGEVDIVPFAQPTDRRDEFLIFSKPLLAVDNFFFVNNSFDDQINKVSLQDKVVAVRRNSAVDIYIKEKYGPNIRTINIDNLAKSLIQLSEGQIDIIATDYVRVAPLINQLAINNVRMEKRVELKYELSIASIKSRPELARQLSKAIEKVSANQLASLRLRWGISAPDVITLREKVYWGLSVGLGVLFIGLLIWSNARLRREVKKREAFEQTLADLNIKSQMQYEEASVEARTDPLTGINNRRRFEDLLSNEISRFQRTGSAFCMMMVDIDYFKLINDEFGHTTGDRVLVDVAKRINHTIRPYDILARLGGEEFGILLPNTLLEEATHIAERLLEVVIDYELDEIPELAVTISIGVKQAELHDTLMTIIDGADKALYQSKNRGRNRVTDYNSATSYSL